MLILLSLHQFLITTVTKENTTFSHCGPSIKHIFNQVQSCLFSTFVAKCTFEVVVFCAKNFQFYVHYFFLLQFFLSILLLLDDESVSLTKQERVMFRFNVVPQEYNCPSADPLQRAPVVTFIAAMLDV